MFEKFHHSLDPLYNLNNSSEIIKGGNLEFWKFRSNMVGFPVMFPHHQALKRWKVNICKSLCQQCFYFSLQKSIPTCWVNSVLIYKITEATFVLVDKLMTEKISVLVSSETIKKCHLISDDVFLMQFFCVWHDSKLILWIRPQINLSVTGWKMIIWKHSGPNSILWSNHR